MAGFAVEQGIFVGVPELVAHFFAVLVFLIHIVGDNGEDGGEEQYDVNHGNHFKFRDAGCAKCGYCG